MASEDESVSIVIDPGSFTFHAGFGGNDSPRCVLPSVVGHPRFGTDLCVPSRPPLPLLGDAMLPAVPRPGPLEDRHPIRDGRIVDWDDFEVLMNHALINELHTDVEDCAVMMAQKVGTPPAQLETMAELLFESFQCPSLYFPNQTTLALIASGRTTGVVVDCGHNSCMVVPIVQQDADNFELVNLAVRKLVWFSLACLGMFFLLHL